MSQAATDRRSQILDQLLTTKQVSVPDLAAALRVSDASVRRDLKALADEGLAELTHGGAVLPKDFAGSYQARALRLGDAKARIGRLAAGLVGDDDLIFLDSGSTCAALVPHLRSRRSLRVVTNSARLAVDLTGPEVILIGGQYRPDRLDSVGPLAHGMLGELRGYRAFIGADGLDREVGPSASDIESAHLHRLAVTNARETVLLVDHSKFATGSLFRITAWDRITTLVTDQTPDATWTAFLAERSIRLLVGNDE